MNNDSEDECEEMPPNPFTGTITKVNKNGVVTKISTSMLDNTFITLVKKALTGDKDSISRVISKSYYNDYDTIRFLENYRDNCYALYMLGKIYYTKFTITGNGGNMRDVYINKATDYFEKSYEKGYNHVLSDLVDMYKLNKQYDKAIKLLTPLVQKNNVFAANKLGGVYEKMCEYDKAIACYNIGAHVDDSWALFLLGNLYHYHYIDIIKATYYYELAYSQGNKFAEFKLRKFKENRTIFNDIIKAQKDNIALKKRLSDCDTFISAYKDVYYQTIL
jgi:tetratricopeptide (TPR) repeat protein